MGEGGRGVYRHLRKSGARAVMAVVITYSGMVGSGKSVCSRYVGSELTEAGLSVHYLRFRFISLKSFFEKKQGFKKFTYKEDKQQPDPGNKKVRFQNFKLKSNLFFIASIPYYFWKACLFFFLIKVRYPKDIVIADRYIYDHLVHYRLEQRGYGSLYRAFLKMLPKPDLSFVLTADFDTIRQARPSYAIEYVRVNLANYNYIGELYPGVILVRENQVKEKIDSVLTIVQRYLHTKNLGG
jgi:thymidylate kinase